MSDEAKAVPLAEFVSGLRAELLAAQAARDPGLQFAVGPVSVEFTGGSGRARGGAGGEGAVLGGGGRRLSEMVERGDAEGIHDVDPGRRHGQPVYILDRVPGPPP